MQKRQQRVSTTVRLSEQGKRNLTAICCATGASHTAAIEMGLAFLARQVEKKEKKNESTHD